MSAIKWAKKDTQLLRRLRECLNNKCIDLLLIDELLTTLEGKVQIPSNEVSRKKRKSKVHSRISRHYEGIVSGFLKKVG